MKVTEEMKRIIIEKYATSDSTELANELGISYHTVMKWARKLKLYKKDPGSFHKIPKEQEEWLAKYYPTESVEFLESKFGKNMHAIGELARKRGIFRKVNLCRKGSLEPLLDGSIQSFYWLGFIAADGYISKTGHLLVSQVDKDKEIVYELAKYLNTDVYTHSKKNSYNGKITKYYRVNIADKSLGVKTREMFGLSETDKKTYTGIDLDFIETEDQAAAFLIGFLDGDSNRTKSGAYRVQCDKSWLNTFTVLNSKLNIKFQFSLKLTYRKDRKKYYLDFFLNSKIGAHLREFADQHQMGSTRKFK